MKFAASNMSMTHDLHASTAEPTVPGAPTEAGPAAPAPDAATHADRGFRARVPGWIRALQLDGLGESLAGFMEDMLGMTPRRTVADALAFGNGRRMVHIGVALIAVGAMVVFV